MVRFVSEHVCECMLQTVKVTSSWHEQLSRSSGSDTETEELSTPPLKHLFFHTLNEQ